MKFRRVHVNRVQLSIAIVLLLTVVAAVHAEDTVAESPALGRIFEDRKIQGTFVLFDVQTGRLVTHDATRAAKRFVPASTFKIANALIGLETGAVKSVDEVLPYGGKPQPFPEWEHDMGLREAIRVSSVPIYQELARRIGLKRMSEWVSRLQYGNATIGTTVDEFWLKGPLEISAIEQAKFLAKVARGEVPMRAETVAAVNAITLLEQIDDYALHGKTGWCTSVQPNIGWWVGWVEHRGQLTATFALNVDIAGKDDVAKRVPLGRACLQELGVLSK